MGFLRATMSVGVLVLMAGCAEAPPESSALPDPNPDAARAAADDPAAPPAHIEFASDVYDFGEMPEIETRTGRFTFTNTGGRALVIEEVKASCGCTVPTLEKRRYEPGEAGEIVVEFEPVASGQRQKKRLNVISNSEPNELVALTIVADVTSFVDLAPRIVHADAIVLGEANEFLVTATCADPSFVIESIVTTNEHASAVVVEPAEGTTRTIRVTVEPTAPWGGFFSWLEVTSRARPTPEAEPVSHTRKVRIQGQVSGQLTARPHTFRFGIKPGEVVTRRAKVWRPSGQPFTLGDVTLVDVRGLENARVRVEPAGAAAYELVLTARAPDRPMTSRGRVTFTTDVPGEETLEIPILGVVRVQARGVQ